jgi:tetratricopeptide (TPR) repeat protein
VATPRGIGTAGPTRPVAPAAAPSSAAAARPPAQAVAAAWLRGEVTLATLRGYSDDELAAVAEVGYALFRQGQHELARTVFEGLQALTGSEYPLRALAAIAVAAQRYADALPLLDAAIARSRSGIAGRLLRAEAFAQLGRYTDAQADLDWILRAAPRDDDEEALRRRAVAMRRRLRRP